MANVPFPPECIYRHCDQYASKCMRWIWRNSKTVHCQCVIIGSLAIHSGPHQFKIDAYVFKCKYLQASRLYLTTTWIRMRTFLSYSQKIYFGIKCALKGKEMQLSLKDYEGNDNKRAFKCGCQSQNYYNRWLFCSQHCYCIFMKVFYKSVGKRVNDSRLEQVNSIVYGQSHQVLGWLYFLRMKFLLHQL